MLIKPPADIPSSEITPERVYLNRRAFLASAVSAGIWTAPAAQRGDEITNIDVATGYNNYYEFGSGKTDPAKYAGSLTTKPWTVSVEGACAKPGTYAIEDILKPHPVQDRTYRHRCVEGWSMVIPWRGVPLGDVLKRFEPLGAAKFVEFVTVLRPKEMPSQNAWIFSLLPWPYLEGLRIDEAMHPLAMLATGMYGQALPNQNGAPLRLVVPWKYGFKGAKAIAKIRFVEQQPRTTWMREEPQFYGFYSNVNPERTNSTFRDQSKEHRLGDLLVRPTLPFNGYANEVASLYAGMDLKRNF